MLFALWAEFPTVWKFGEKNVNLQCRFVRFLFKGLRKKSDKMTMKSKIM